jgi:hypothetical protein
MEMLMRVGMWSWSCVVAGKASRCDVFVTGKAGRADDALSRAAGVAMTGVWLWGEGGSHSTNNVPTCRQREIQRGTMM